MDKLIIIMTCFVWMFSSVPTENNMERKVCECQQAEYESPILDVREVWTLICQSSLKVQVEVKYVVGTKPPTTFYYTRTKDGVKKAGTLTLDRVRYMSDATYAVYIGYIYPVE